MSLDKQRILSELGSVVNQLQSADCGCMGKLFSNSGQENSNAMAGQCGGGMRGCCGHGCHGFNSPCAGEPCTGARHCMGFCNPPKLYADTYNYLNHNLMQPVVKEVYDDLKSITPANTIMNNPLGAQMGLSPTNNNNPGNMMTPTSMSGGPMNQNSMLPNMGQPPSPRVNFANANNTSSAMNNPNSQQMGQMGTGIGQMGQEMNQGMGQMGQGASGGMLAGMGPQIVNMMHSAKYNNAPNQANAQSSPPGDNMQQSPGMGQMPPNIPVNANQGQFNNLGQLQNNTGYMGGSNMPSQGSPGIQTTQYMTQPNMYGQGNAMPMNQMNPGTQQMRNVNAPQMNNGPYGQHSAGMAKFKDMFPGVVGDDLGFDPMSIAIQMNPENQQRSAMDAMQKVMMGNAGGINKIMDATGNATAQMQPVINAANTAAAGIAQPNQAQSNQQQIQQVTGQQNITQAPVQQQQPGTLTGAIPMQNNQVYTGLTGAPTMNQQQMVQQPITTQQQLQPQQLQPPQMQTQQLQQQLQPGQTQLHQYQPPSDQKIDPNTGAVLTVASLQQPPAEKSVLPTPIQEIYKEPIFPADTSRNLLHSHHFAKPFRNVQYNTLGQPIEMLNAKQYWTPIPDLPQTLSPQIDQTKVKNSGMKYSNVKSTVSKTALMENGPVGRTSSRNQLQHIYNQYKGSQSFTQQNIRPAEQGVSYSAGHINIPQSNVQRHVPVERVGGDTAANNLAIPAGNKLQPMMNQIGDVPVATKPYEEISMAMTKNTKLRNGLQDQVFTSAPTSAKWSFHGDGRAMAPFSVGYRFRTKS